ncbi:GGDEF domain-containing protein [Croceicoccus marinus]|uniref:diguanylate cyclase n=1 Tax=Croceicoccus marinus TaxID=450378 RepID=A0A7G6W175_9SPHN|nr:GGDEF domain-containing protein [Croceicoccus marinus]QNE07740.1 GGDEF domain-containing protein [Croceicoccus marinus]
MRTTSEEALAFLERHRLPPTPQNYTLAYIAVDEPTSRIGLAVKAIAEDGVRMRQEEADEIVALYAGDSIRHSGSNGDGERRRLEAQAERLGALTATAAAQSQEFVADLDSEAQQLDSQAARTVQIVARMIERSKQAEDNFRSALREIEALRQELATARGDAERDALTGLPNRRRVERQLEELASAGRKRTVGLCDIDSFKRVNDRFGHTVGDRVLKMVASSLATSCAPHLVGRWGGEEFIVVMDGGNAAACTALLDQARADLASRRFKLRETDEPLGVISFSAGVAEADGDASNTPGALHRADAAMYAAKQAGRNQVMLG